MRKILRPKDLAILALVAAIYFSAARLGLSLASVHKNVSPVWPPTGVAMAAVLILGLRTWPGILLGALLANALTPVPLWVAAGIAFGNTLEALSAGLLLRSLDFRKSLDRAKDVFSFVVAALGCTMFSATIGNLVLCLSHSARWSDFGSLWTTWWLGDTVGALVLTPLLLTWAIRPKQWLPARRQVEAVIVLVLLTLSALATFGRSSVLSIHYFPFVRLTVPIFLWAAFRLRQRGVTLSSIVLSVFAVWGTANGLGPFVTGGDPNESLLLLQIYLGSNAVTFLFLGAVIQERRRSNAILRENEKRLAVNLAITRILAESPALADATPQFLQTIANSLGWEVGCLWTVDRKDNLLRSMNVWRSPRSRAVAFEQICRERTFQKSVGLPGRVWQNLTPTWIPDVTKDDNFPRAQQASAAGLHSAFGFPILLNEEFLGVMEFFDGEIREPDEQLLAMFAGIGSQIGQFIERKRAEAEVESVSLLPKENPYPVLRVDRDGTVVYCNPAAMAILMDWQLETGETAPSQIIEAAKEAQSQHSHLNKEIEVGGQTYGLNFAPIAQGEYVNIYFNDITEQKRGQEEIVRLLSREREARQEAEIANRAKDDFLAVLSHELRTPLTAILGWLTLMRANKLDERTTTHAIETIERNAKAQAQLIEDLVDVSRIVGGKLSLEVRPTDLLSVVNAAIEVIRPAADAKFIKLEVNSDSWSGFVSGDPARLQQVIANLLSNAVKFTPNGGSVSVVLINSGAHAEVSVHDTGIGISPDFLPHVFERFRQAESAATRSHRGLGLGLAIVRHLVELHGGSVKARSDGENQGATFAIQLPLTAPAPAGSAENRGKHDGEARLDGLRVLLVEDEADARELIALALQNSGANVEAVESVQDALARLELSTPDVLLSDIGLPVESGYDLIKKIRNLDGHANQVPAIALTAFATENDRRSSLAAGFHAHLAKPIEPQRLIKAIKTLLERNLT